MNNADIAINALRKTQEYVFDRNASPNSVFQKIEQDIEHMRKASKQINTYESQLSRVLNTLNDKSLLSDEVLAAFTGLSVDAASKLKGDIEAVKETMIK